MSNIHDVVVELSKLTVRALRELGNAGPEARERACQLAGQAWALLHREHPDAAERMNGVLHFLTGPRFAGPTPVAFESVSPAMAGVVVEEGDTSAAQSIADAFLRTGDASAEASRTANETRERSNEADGAPASTVGSEHPWLPAPDPLKTPAEVSAYYTRVDALAKLGRDFDMEVRHLIPADRHTLIIHAFNQLQPGQGFVLVNDHDPKPLYYQFAFEYADRFTWDPIEEGPEVWRVRIGRR